MSEWPYDYRGAAGNPQTRGPAGEPGHEVILTQNEHMAERDHVDTVAPGKPAHELREAASAGPVLTGEERSAFERKTGDDLPNEPFLVTLYFRTGLVKSFWVSSFETVEDSDGFTTHAIWDQDNPRPGDELLQYLDFNEVIMATTQAVEVP